MKEFVHYLITHLVDEPNNVRIHEILGQRIIVYELHVRDEDVARIIGRHGETVRSLRTILSAAAARRGKKIILEILENDKKYDSTILQTPVPT